MEPLQVMISDSNPVLIVSLALTVAFLVAYALVRLPRGGRRSLPPSPPGLPVIGNLHQLGSLPHRSLAALSEKHGAVMLLRLGQTPTVVVSSAEAVKEIFKKHDVAFSGRPKAAASDALFYEGKNIAFSPYNEEWRQARKICTVQLLSQKRVSSFGRVRQEEVSKIVAALRSATTPVNLSNLIMVTANDITTRCIIGQRFSDGSGFLGDAAKKVTVLLVALSFADFFPYFGGWIDRLRGFTARLSSTARLLDDFYTQVVEEHDPTKRDGSGHTDGDQHVEDFVDILLHLKASHEFDHLTPVHIKAILQDMLLAGVETSSTTMEWIMAELVKHPREMEKVQEEVRRVVGPGKDMVEMEEIESMEYFKCAVKEAMRLHPPFPFLLPRQTLDTDTHIVGYDIPRHTKVLVNAWAIHRDPATWDRPHDFVPERFLENPLNFKPRDAFHYIPFGFGRRDCPGMALGMVNVQYLIANLLYAFDWTLPADNGTDGDPQKFDMTEAYGITVGKKTPLLLIPKPYHPSA